jgi:RNA polymerase sigma-70 factor (ECF subfamily)
MMDKRNTEKDFVKLINEYQGLIHKVSFIYERNDENRKDLFQEIVLQLWRAFPSFKGQAKITTWIYRIALNTAISSLRKTSRTPESTDLDNQKFQIADDNESASRREQFQMLENAINQLSEIEKAMIMLYLDEIPYEEIAETLGITQNNVRVKMNRIREKLKKIMKA